MIICTDDDDDDDHDDDDDDDGHDDDGHDDNDDDGHDNDDNYDDNYGHDDVVLQLSWVWLMRIRFRIKADISSSYLLFCCT